MNVKRGGSCICKIDQGGGRPPDLHMLQSETIEFNQTFILIF